MTQCWKCGDIDAEFQKKCDVPACGMKEQKEQRTWVGLTDSEFAEACQMAERGNYLVAFQHIQTKLKEKNCAN